jgi:hypothetical protein
MKSKSKVLFVSFVCAVGLVACLTLLANGQPNEKSRSTLSEPNRRVFFGQQPFSLSTVVPNWDKNYLVTQESEVSSSKVPNVRLFDAMGAMVRQASVWLPGSSKVGLIDTAVTNDGRIVSSGVAIKDDGTRAYFIAQTDLKGTVTNVIQTNPFHPQNICAASDGTVWSFGGLGSAPSAQTEGQELLRQFHFDKGLVKSHLPKSSFDASARPAYRLGKGAVYLRCQANGLVIYSEVAKEFIQLDFRTGEVQRFAVAATPLKVNMDGFAVTDDGEVFGLFSGQGTGMSKKALLHLVREDSARKTSWEPVEITSTAPSVDRLLGSDGKNLVYMNANEGFAFFWATPHVHERLERFGPR